MDKHKALAILQSIHKDVCGEWRIPHHYQAFNREVTLNNGQKVNVAFVDEIDEFLIYVEKLIKNQEEEC